MIAERKQEAREKFLLGGIVIKAGLLKADRAFLLGGLLELARVTISSPEHQRLRDIGEEAFKLHTSTSEPTRSEEMQE